MSNQTIARPAGGKARAISILGMHRSGTSTVARALNLMGVHLGDASQMLPPSPDNPEGYWEHLEILNWQSRVMTQLGKVWDDPRPLPDGWLDSAVVRPLTDELQRLLAANFDGRVLWGWKEPRSCLLLPIWREVLERNDTKLSCLFVVRNPADVAASLERRDKIPGEKALGIWFLYNLTALADSLGLPAVFLSYDRLVDNWEPEMRRVAAELNIDWPADDQQYQTAMNAFLKPGLRHRKSSAASIEGLPRPVRELYEIMHQGCVRTPDREHLAQTIRRLATDFRAYASLLFGEVKPPNSQKTSQESLHRLGVELRDCIALHPAKTRLARPELIAAWRENSGRPFQFEVLKTTWPTPKWLHMILGKKLTNSLSKRLVEMYCWLHP